MNRAQTLAGSLTPPPSWKVQILTPAYLVEGEILPIPHLQRYLSRPEQQSPLSLSGAHVHSLINTISIPRTISRWTLPATALVALIPRDSTSMAALEQLTVADQPAETVVMYAGPYRIRATFLSDGTEPMAAPWVAATEAEITYGPEQQYMPRVRARLLVLWRQWIYGYHAA